VAEGDSAAVSFVLMLNAKAVPALLLKKIPPCINWLQSEIGANLTEHWMDQVNPLPETKIRSSGHSAGQRNSQQRYLVGIEQPGTTELN